MLDAANYADAESHKKLHAEFVKKLGGVSAPVDQATVDFAKTWLVGNDGHETIIYDNIIIDNNR